MELVRNVDLSVISAAERARQVLLDPSTGITTCSVNYLSTPPGMGSPEGTHKHGHDQVFYVVGGTMRLDLGGKDYTLTAGSLAAIPAGTLHRFWNEGPGPMVHLSINAPAQTKKRAGGSQEAAG